MDSRDGLAIFRFLFTGEVQKRGKPKNRTSAKQFPHKSYPLDQNHIHVSSKEREDVVNCQPNWQCNPGGLFDVVPTSIEVPGSRCPDGV